MTSSFGLVETVEIIRKICGSRRTDARSPLHDTPATSFNKGTSFRASSENNARCVIAIRPSAHFVTLPRSGTVFGSTIPTFKLTHSKQKNYKKLHSIFLTEKKTFYVSFFKSFFNCCNSKIYPHFFDKTQSSVIRCENDFALVLTFPIENSVTKI